MLSATTVERLRAKLEKPRNAAYVEAEQYLDFKYGARSVEITLPDGTTAKLVAGNDGRIYIQQ